MDSTMNDVCSICGKLTMSGVDYEDADVYHMECLKHSPKMIETREITQKYAPERAVSWEKPL